MFTLNFSYKKKIWLELPTLLLFLVSPPSSSDFRWDTSVALKKERRSPTRPKHCVYKKKNKEKQIFFLGPVFLCSCFLPLHCSVFLDALPVIGLVAWLIAFVFFFCFVCRNPLDSQNPVSTAKLQLNGHDRFATRNGEYFNWVPCYQHHTNIPESPGINVYSFALKPEEHQPSGSCNFSRIDNATLVLDITFNSSDLTTAQAKVRVYAVNYNVLRIMSGINRNDILYRSTCAQQSVAQQVIGNT